MRKFFLLFTIFANSVCAQVPTLLKNINTDDNSSDGFSNNAKLGSSLVFSNKTEIWKTDGTTANTVLVKDLKGDGVSAINRLATTPILIFFATDFNKLWKTDGTEAGTVLVKDFGSNAIYQSFATVGNILYFSAESAGQGRELWKSDGTEAGTILVKDIYPGPNSSAPQTMVNLNGTLLFTADTAIGSSLWKSDGTEAGTVLVADLDANSTGYGSARDIIAGNTRVYFGFTHSQFGWELFTSDGTTSGTGIVKDLNPGIANGIPGFFATIGDNLYFNGRNATSTQLWKTDGTDAGTISLFDLVPNSNTDNCTNLTNCNGILYFTPTKNASDIGEPYKSDGTAAGTVLVKRINQTNTNGSGARNYIYYNGLVYFAASEPAGVNAGIYRTDGSTLNTTISIGITPSLYANGSIWENNNLLHFAASTANQGIEPFVSDGTTATLLKNIETTGLSSGPNGFQIVGNKVFFEAKSEGFTNFKPFYTDGTAAGTMLLKDVNVFSQDFEIDNMDNANFNFLSTGLSGTSIIKSDGTTAGTVSIVPNFTTKRNFKQVNNIVFYDKTDGTTGNELWKFENNASSLVADLRPGAQSASPSNFTKYNNEFYFIAFNGTVNKMYKSDGSAAGTLPFYDFVNKPVEAHIIEYNGSLYFTDIIGGVLSLFKTNGTNATVMMVKQFTADDKIDKFYLVNGLIYFFTKNEITGFGDDENLQLWKSDGSPTGTEMIKEVFPITNIANNIDLQGFNITALNATTILFFANRPADLSGNDGEIHFWKSDGTEAGTVELATEYLPNETSSRNFYDYLSNYIVPYDANTALFTFYDAAHGQEIWKTDGTVAGTILSNDIEPGPLSSGPANYILFPALPGPINSAKKAANTNIILFSVTTNIGAELWKIESQFPLPLELINFSGKNENGSNTLSWQTANEVALSHFEIERSENAKEFEKIAEVNSKGGPSEKVEYEFINQAPPAPDGRAFYRLKMVDLDGSFKYSKIIYIENKPQSALKIFPNPTSNYFSLNSNENFDEIKIVNQFGQIFKKYIYSSDNEYNITDLPKGFYQIIVKKDKGSQVYKLVVN
jgi:trimeric autotransporter adhesin